MKRFAFALLATFAVTAATFGSAGAGQLVVIASKGSEIGVGAILLAIGLVGAEIAELDTWAMATTPVFIGEMAWQIGTVVGAYWGGRLATGGTNAARATHR